MPRIFHFDANLNRAFTLNPKDTDHPRTLTFNIRNANLLNHTNVTSMKTILLLQQLSSRLLQRLPGVWSWECASASKKLEINDHGGIGDENHGKGR